MKALDETAQRYRDLLLETIEPHKDLPLILSGGVDSGTLLAAQLALGVKPTVYTFQLGEEDNPDLAVVRRMARDHALDLQIISIPQSRTQLVEDVYAIIKMTGLARKTVIQCVQPMMHLAHRVGEDGWEGCIIGTGAVVLDDRTVMVKLAAEGEEAAREYRRLKLWDRADLATGTGWMHEVCRRLDVPAEEPYSDEPLRSYALSLDIGELARGPDGRNRQKGIAWRAFPSFWGRSGYWRRNSSFQISTGIREWHESLLVDPLFNPFGEHRRVVAIYGRILKEVEQDVNQLHF